MPEVLFVCSVNRFRSVIAAEYFRLLLQRRKYPGGLADHQRWHLGEGGVIPAA